ncbi:MAG: adenylate/guanylate cyclase domain-containing protein [Saprospiraceae bacterium]|nr:adenylate/guanylate cyclase domain-containing protein [Saprospiraceae bacterium]
MQKRQLATIVFADLVGYTAMMQSNEQRAVHMRNAFRQAIEQCTPQHAGRIIQYYGDGCLLLFDSGKVAVTCGMQLQIMFREREIPVRIGMHLGDVTYDDSGAYGDTVNMAARVESFAVEGAVFLSAKVYDEVRNQPEVSCQSLGKFRLKNVPAPMEIYAVSNDGFPVPDPDTLEGKGNRVTSSIAVLAFTNMSNDPDQEFFGDGISEEIINALVRLPELKVAGRTSSFSFKGRDMDLREIGRQLDVSTVLEGSVRKAGNRVRVTAQLINVEDGFHLWSERYDRELEDIFAIQDDIAQNITEKLKVTLLEQHARHPLVTAPTQNVHAYQWYLRGRYFLDQRAHIRQARACFEKARELDDQYALAWSGLAYTHFYEIYFDGKPPLDNFPLVRQAADRAISINPDLAEPYVMKALTSFYFDWDFAEAARQYNKAVSLNPLASDTYRVKAYYHSMIGEPEAGIELARKALDLDPLNINIRLSLAELLYRGRHFEAAISAFRDLVRDFPGLTPARFMLSNSYYFVAKHDEAKTTLEEGVRRLDMPNFYLFTSIALLALMGEPERARDLYGDVLQRYQDRWVSPIARAHVVYCLGDHDAAADLVRQGIAEKDPVLLVLNSEPAWTQHLEEPVVKEFLEEVGLR